MSEQANVEAARAQFDRQAAHYNERWASWSDEALEKMLALGGAETHWRVLDIATGTGFTALAFAPLAREVIGTDISEKMLAEARKRTEAASLANVSFQSAPADHQPFPDAAFDLVTCRIAPHHFPDVSAFAKEAFRVLKPGGVFLLCDTTVPDEDAEAGAWQNAVEKERDPSHIKNLSPGEWQRILETAGFRITDTDTTGGIPIVLSAWLETAGCTGERAERVRQMFRDAPPSAKAQFAVETKAGELEEETRFVWQRVLLRAVSP